MKFVNTLKEVFLSSLPLAAIILLVCGFLAPFANAYDYIKLTLGYLGVVIGQALFLVGLDHSILPIGKLVGSSLIRLEKVIFIILTGVVFGLVATVAEPALAVLAHQTNMVMDFVNARTFVWVMSIGIGVFVGFALWRIIKDLNIKIVFAALYVLVFFVVIFVPEEFIALAFDGSGATTGDISVPFILALGLGASATMSKHKTNDDTFGIIGLASVGPILALFVYGIILNVSYGGEFPPADIYNPGAADNLLEITVNNLGNVALALVPVLAVFLPFQIFLIKLAKKEIREILFGSIVVYVGLLIFLTGIDYGFAFAGEYIGAVFLDPSRPDWFQYLLLIVSFILGMAITLTEPAVTVLGEQLEEITNGHIKKLTIRLALAIGIGFAAILAMIKILTQINILWFLVPLYLIALIMMPFTSKLFVGLAFDSGGVSGGALTSAFLTPLTLGAAQAVAKNTGVGAQSVLTNGFGIIAFISVTPLITVQALGIIYDIRRKVEQKRMEEAELLEIGELQSFAESDEDVADELNDAADDAAIEAPELTDTEAEADFEAGDSVPVTADIQGMDNEEPADDMTTHSEVPQREL